MKSWPLKTRFGLYCAGLSTLAALAAVLAVRPLVFRHQLSQLDAQLAEDAEELFRDIEGFKGPPVNYRKPLAERLIPAVLRGRYIEIIGPEGQLLHRSPNLRDFSLSAVPEGVHTLVVNDRNARIGTFNHGFLKVRLGTRLGTLETVQQDILQTLWWIAPLTGITVFAAGWLLGRRALRPVSVLSSAAERIDPGAPERLPVPSAKDEIHRLTEVLNRSFDRLQAAYAAAAQFSADASHQLRTPVAVLRAGLDSLRTAPDCTPAFRTELDALLKQTRRLTTLTKDLLLLAKADAGRLDLAAGEVDLSALARAAADDAGILCEARGITLETEADASVAARGDARRIAVILQNLTENAVKYAGDDGRVTITCLTDSGQAIVRVGNTGQGIPAEHHASLFSRFYRAGAGENIRGAGLGLNIARTLARAQHGDVTLISSGDNWTEFELRLPAA